MEFVCTVGFEVIWIKRKELLGVMPGIYQIHLKFMKAKFLSMSPKVFEDIPLKPKKPQYEQVKKKSLQMFFFFSNS